MGGLTTRAYHVYRNTMLKELDPKLVATKLIAQGETPPTGARSITSEEIKRLKGRAKIGRPGQPIPRETVEVDRAAVYIPEIVHGFKLSRKDIEASENFGTPLPTANAQASAQLVREEIENLILNGNDSLNIKGIYADAGANGGSAYSVEEDKEWNTASADIVSDFLEMVELLEPYEPGRMLLDPKAYMMLFKPNSFGIKPIDHIAEFFPNGKADIYKVPQFLFGEDKQDTTPIPAATGLLCAYGNDFGERWVEEEVNLRQQVPDENENIPYNIVTYQTVDIHQTGAYLKLDNLVTTS